LTASVNLLNTRRPDLRLLGAVSAALLLAACSKQAPPKAQAPTPPPQAEPAQEVPVAAPAVARTPTEVSGFFTSLPSPNQVLAATAIGRDDPFAPETPQVSGGAINVKLDLPPDFRFSGVIRSGSTPQAMVQFGGNSGALSVGEKGGEQTDLLPEGWSVAGIDVDRGRLLLRQGKQEVIAEL
jgi:hypothetical protein